MKENADGSVVFSPEEIKELRKIAKKALSMVTLLMAIQILELVWRYYRHLL